MAPTCCIPYCKNGRSNGHILHSFPRDGRLSSWIAFVHRCGFAGWTVQKRSFLCDAHFQDEHYTSKDRKHLLPTAVPTRFSTDNENPPTIEEFVTFADYFKRKRKEFRLSQLDVSKAIGCNRAIISKFESLDVTPTIAHKYMPALQWLLRMCDVHSAEGASATVQTSKHAASESFTTETGRRDFDGFSRHQPAILSEVDSSVLASHLQNDTHNLIQNGSVTGVTLRPALPSTCLCGAGYISSDSTTGQYITECVTTLLTRNAPVKCTIQRAVCLSGSCTTSYTGQQQSNIHFWTVDTACGYEKGNDLPATVTAQYETLRSDEWYVCSKCGNLFALEDEFNTHMSTVHGHVNVDVNMKSVHDYTPFVCVICSTSYANKEALIQHHQTHFDEKYVCALCNREFPSNYNLDAHVSTVHDCVKLFDSSKKYLCGLCDKLVASKHALNVHMSGHLGVKCSLACPVCGRQFKRECTMKNHVRFVHRDRKQYVCIECCKQFKRSRCVVSHWMKVHVQKCH